MAVATGTRIPLVDLGAQFAAIRHEVLPAVEAVMSRSAFIHGPYVDAFEREFASFTGRAHAIGAANGTEAIFVALKALGVRPGDEVITVANTFTSTAEAIEWTGARPRLVEIDPRDHLIDPSAVEAAIGPRTVGIVPVHLFGQPARMRQIQRIAQRHGLFVVEDAAQAHGASEDGRPVGEGSAAATYSFYPGKNLGAYGDAGAVTTDDAVLAQRIRLVSDHGRVGKYEHAVVGYGSRLDGLQAAILSVKLRHLPAWTEARRRLAARYDRLLAALPGVQPVLPRADVYAVYHLYVVEVDAAPRDDLRAWLDGRGIDTGIHYPIPLHLQPAYAHLDLQRGAFPIAEAKAERIVSLPLYPELSEQQQNWIVESVGEFFRRR
ncbi:MAG: DegT/DnrJ/EryC1/StrS family aminotransferase [Chloroflexi bacterium]|nr:DegT/DnrJ/EryC1/StrS family aminotransferase [Chloroflexota bacterium]